MAGGDCTGQRPSPQKVLLGGTGPDGLVSLMNKQQRRAAHFKSHPSKTHRGPREQAGVMEKNPEGRLGLQQYKESIPAGGAALGNAGDMGQG